MTKELLEACEDLIKNTVLSGRGESLWYQTSSVQHVAFCQAVERARNENNRSEVENGWKPIETAPKDRTSILGTEGSSYTVVHWTELGGGYWSLDEPGSYADNSEWWPTHWMPLPTAPSTEGEK